MAENTTVLDPSKMNAKEVAERLWIAAKTEPLELAELMIWAGVACATLMKCHRQHEAPPELPS